MNTKILLALIALLGLSTVYINQHSSVESSQDAMIANEFSAWKLKHGIAYEISEEAYRFSVFKSNYLFAQEFNAKQTGTLRLGMTPFAGMTNEEFADKMTMKVDQPVEDDTQESINYRSVQALPTEVDWVKKGAVTAVENQGQCGSCWAFSTKESLEGIYQIKTGKLVTFSAQELVSCSKGNYGCNGGWPLVAMRFTQQNGIETNSAYPYEDVRGGEFPCKYNKSDVVFKNTGQAQVKPSNNAEALMENVARQPLSILVQAASITWQLYNGGIMDNTNCPTQTDHAVLLVGYNSSASTPYWQVKNSWGASWGEKGYCQVMIEKTGRGVCGIQQSAYYPEYNN